MNLLKIVLGLSLAVLLSCSPKIATENEVKAGNVAADYMQVVLLDGDYIGGYKFLHQTLRDELPLEVFIPVVRKMALEAKVVKVQSVSFATQKGSDEVTVFLSALSSNQKEGYFHVVMTPNGPKYQILEIETIETLPKEGRDIGSYKNAGVEITREASAKK